MSNSTRSRWIPIGLLLTGLLCIPVFQLRGLTMMPGDLGDARLNNYFLENIFQFLIGRSESLWHLPFFYPFPYVLGFSDNLFGSAPIYLLARILVGEPDTAFQLWFYAGYVTNYGAAWWALRRMGGGVWSSSVGALIFAFALPTTTHVGHAQLHYRFGIPLSIVFFAEYLNKGSLRSMLWAGMWFVWQFYAGIYMGFFTLLMLVAMLVGKAVDLLLSRVGGATAPRIRPHRISSWGAQNSQERLFVALGLVLLLLLMIALLYPYLQVTRLYGAKRSWDEIASMLPKPESYLLADASLIWGNNPTLLADVPMRNEHQMLSGLMPWALALLGVLTGSRKKDGQTYVAMTAVLLVPLLVTLFVGGFSFWQYLRELPLVSAIRVMTRLDQVLLFPMAYFSMLAMDKWAAHSRTEWSWPALLLATLTLVECAAVRYLYIGPKSEWRDRITALEVKIPPDLPNDAVLFFAQHSAPFNAVDIDAMWVALKLGVPTLNGYTGNQPPDYQPQFNLDCAELPLRLLSYMKFSGRADGDTLYRSISQRVVPIGFENCDPSWFLHPPRNQLQRLLYTAKHFQQLSYTLNSRLATKEGAVVSVILANRGDTPLSAKDQRGRQMRLSWRYLDANRKALGSWDEVRKPLPSDVPARGSVVIEIKADKRLKEAKFLQVSMVQEGVFWAHDVGLAPLVVDLDDAVLSPPGKP